MAARERLELAAYCSAPSARLALDDVARRQRIGQRERIARLFERRDLAVEQARRSTMAGALGEDRVQALAQLQDLAGLDLQIGGLPAACRLATVSWTGRLVPGLATFIGLIFATPPSRVIQIENP